MTRRLYLLRHAKSSWDDPTLPDHDRPLAARGRRAADRIGRYLREARVEPALVICSSSLRTRETLEQLGAPFTEPTRVRVERSVYAARADALLSLLRGLPAAADSALLIGHNPGVQDLVVLLAIESDSTTQVEDKFPTGALATLELDGGWDELAPATCRLVELVFPRELA